MTEQDLTVMSHPTDEMLARFAGGAVSAGMELLVAAHLTYCPTCRRKVDGYEAIGGASLLQETADIAAPSLDAALLLLDLPEADAPEAAAPQRDAAVFPAPIRQLLKPDEPIRWQFRMPGLHEHRLEGFDDEQVSLLRVKPGVGMLGHTHDGEEATLVFSGAMQDGGQVYRTGDVALADHNHDHNPRIVGDEICYCLIVLSGSMRFTGPVGRALNLLRGD